MLTRIMHQISHIFDLNKIKNNFIFYLKRCAFREGTPFIHFQLTVSDPAFADPYSAHQWHRKTVLFSTHILDVAEKLCDRVAIIKNGKIVKTGNMKDVKGDESLEQVFLELGE